MEVHMFPMGPLEVNCYLLLGQTENGLEAVAIDPGGNPHKALDLLDKTGAKLTHVLITHLHFDHTGGVRALAEATGATVYASSRDASLLDSELGRGGFMGLPEIELFEFMALAPGEHRFVGERCLVLATPGHSAGSLSFYFPAQHRVFVGDLLFNRSVGRTDFPGGDYNTLIRSIKEQIFTLPGDTIVHSGHGDPTTVQDERMHNPYLTEF
ncbi:MBL fold metallo-hydrolase [Megalodesulfovibrio paquesii]